MQSLKVTISYAQSLDGKIAAMNGESRYISEKASLELNQQMRRDHDAILVGIGTVLADDPLLTCRIDPAKNPLRVILDSRLRIPVESQLIQTASKVPTIIFCRRNMDRSTKERFQLLTEKGVEVVAVEKSDPEDDLNTVSEAAVLQILEQRGIVSVLVEGGGGVITQFLKKGLWHSLVVVSTGKLMGTGVEAIGDIGVNRLDQIKKPNLKNITVLDSEVVWEFENRFVDGHPPVDSRIGSIENVASTRILQFMGPGRVAVTEGPIQCFHNVDSQQGKTTGLFRSRLMAISPGTERHFFLGNFQTEKVADPTIDCISTTFTYPFAYGYINVLEEAADKSAREKGRYFGLLPHVEMLEADPASLISLPTDIDDETALFIPHTETALSIIQDSRPVFGDRILVTGAGVTGVLVARLLSQYTGVEVTVLDPKKEKKRWFQHINFLSDPKELQFLPSFDRAIEVSGNEAALQTCIDHLIPEGEITVASWYGDREVSLNLGSAFHRKRLLLKSSQVSNISPHLGGGWNKERRMRQVLAILSTLSVKDLLTHRFSFSFAQDAYNLLLDQDAVYGLIALVPGE